MMLATTILASQLILPLPEALKILPWRGEAPCISPERDIGACRKPIKRTFTNAAGVKESATFTRPPYHEWTPPQYALATLGWAFALADVATTAYFLNAPSCVGKIEEANPLVSVGGPVGGPLILLTTKVILKTVTWIGGDSRRGKNRTRTWAIAMIPDGAVSAWNVALIAKRCDG